MTFYYGFRSGSADPYRYLWLMDPDHDSVQDPDIFVTDLQHHNKKLIKKVFLLITFWRYIYIIFRREKVKKNSQYSRSQVFSFHFCLIIEESRSIPLTNRSRFGSRRPKNIRIRIWIRIRNTGRRVLHYWFLKFWGKDLLFANLYKCADLQSAVDG